MSATATPVLNQLRRQVVAYPFCVQTCIDNVNAIAGTFGGCTAGDTLCLCEDADFGYAMRDCTAAICDQADAQIGVNYLISACAAAAAVASAAGSTVGSLEATASSVLYGSTNTAAGQSSLPDFSSGSLGLTATPTAYTTFTTTGVFTFPTVGQLTESTYTFTETVTNSSFYALLQQQRSSTSSPSTSSTNTEVTPASTTVVSSSNNSGGNNGGLTTGAKIGIGISVSLGVLFVLGIAAILFWRSRRRRQPTVQDAEPNAYGRKAELHNQNLPRTHGRSELSEKRAPVELDATTQTRKAELIGDDVHVAELRTNVTNADTTTQSSLLERGTSERHVLS